MTQLAEKAPDIKPIPGLENFDQLPDSAGVRQPVVKALLGCSDATIWRLVKRGKLKTIRISERVTTFQVGSVRGLLGGGG